MKTLSFILLFSAFIQFSFCQSEAEKFKLDNLKDPSINQTELKAKLDVYDFSELFTHADNSIVYGFIGENCQRIRIKFIKITKDSSTADRYLVYGKSMVKNNIDEFHGWIKISNIRKSKITQHGCENGFKFEGYKGQFVILGDYELTENLTQKYPGIFKGSFKTLFFLNKDFKVKYDDIEDCSDSYTNNQFVGQWFSQNNNIIKRCNWGDFRIPNSGDFDIGAGEFSPDRKYLKYGWQTLDNLGALSLKNKKDRKNQNAQWW